MRILVQKFGGTSLATAQAREFVVRHIARERELGYATVVVVSAMGRSGDPYATDTLLRLITENGDMLPAKEKDMLLGCGEIISAAVLCSRLRSEGIPAVALTGGAAGIVTDSSFGQARIVDIQNEPMLNRLRQGEVVIVAGFQGRTDQGEMTTLGRGGSDTSATAIGAALRAERVDIYTDVNGILTADPRFVSEAKPIATVGYAEICNMARQGAKVIHPRAVEIAQQARIPLRVRSTFSDDEGTLVTDDRTVPIPTVRDKHVTGIAHVAGVTQISVFSKDGQNDVQLQVFQSMARNGISVDFINVTPGGAVYTVFDHDAAKAVEVLEKLGYVPNMINGCAKVSVIGGGMNGVPGIMARIVEALSESGVTILQSADSNTTIWVLVQQEDMVAALRALHAKFELHL
ncbi:aspartate kinase, monofunctional class [Paenibacillus curdlanolyticus YK9]|uniref:Aspartokinase n=1 Tax=Paenibacillus curdlanolyticus YK9 TaxID=717606 RepID=E0I4A3_9BACL|nr:aspartate kinase [Paenibacillus curdlanolyticus]EFM13117.1 aspartate kinase, monofunctional class [Paenibacillus curdlanolyticus YK9]